MTFIVVLVGWVFSLTLHEFSHAFVAYRGGDYTVKDKGYLTFNPLKYTHPVYSILLPLVFLLLGGIGLPGGAVYIETWRLYSRKWHTAALFNLLPVPPFDGFGAIRPYLSQTWNERMADFSQISMWVVLALFWYVPLIGNLFWGLVGLIARLIGIPINLAILGQSQFTFWR